MRWYEAPYEDLWGGGWKFSDDMELLDQTEALRRMSAVHRESRDIVLRRFPETLRMADAGSGDAEVRFNKQRDIAYIKTPPSSQPQRVPYTDGFSEHLERVAFPALDDYDIIGFVNVLPGIKTVYTAVYSFEYRTRDLLWCGSPSVLSARVETYEKEPGYGEDLQWIYCWPDASVPSSDFVSESAGRFARMIDPWGTDEVKPQGVRFAPMVCFEFEAGERKLQKVIARFEANELRPDGDDDEEDSESSDESSESSGGSYESEGIDDAEILETYSSSEDELIPDPVVSGDSGSEEEDVIAVDAGGVPLGNFSSPEPDSEDNQQPDDDRSSPVIVARRPKRRIVDSDDEDSGDEEPSRKRARTGDALVISDDDEEDEAPRTAAQRGQKSRRPRVISSDEESGSDDPAPAPHSEGDDTSESSEDADEDEDEDDEPPRPKSFLANLRRDIAADRAAAARHNESSDDSRTMSPDDSDDDDDEDEEDEDGLIDNMAMESDDGSGGDESEGW